MTRLRAIAAGDDPSRLDNEERLILGLIISGRRDREIALESRTTLAQVRDWVAAIVEKLSG